LAFVYRAHARLLLCALLVFIASNPARALDPDRTILQFAHTTWKHAQGAPDTILTIAEGTDGFLWIGADRGLYRFDGVTFEPVDGDESLPLKGERVSYMTKAPDGAVLAVVGQKVVRIKDGKVALLPMTGWPADRDRFVVDLDGVYWVITRAGALWRIEGGTSTVMDASWKYPFKGRAEFLHIDHVGGLLVLAFTDDAVLAHIARGSKEFEIAYQTDSTDVAEAADGSLWLSSPHGLSVIPAGAAPSTKPLVLSTDPYGTPRFDRDGGLWIQARDGLAHIGHPEQLLRGNAMEAIRAQTMTPERGLTSDVIWQILEDHEGNIWTITSNGLDRFRETTMTPVTLPRRSLNFALAPADGGAVWAANFNGNLIRVDGQRVVDVAGVGPGIDELCTGANGGTWVTSRSNNVWHSTQGGAFEKIKIPSSFFFRFTLSCMEDQKGDLWIGFPNGIGKIAGGQWAGLQTGNGIPEGQLARRMMTDKRGRFWIAGRADLNVIDHGVNRALSKEKDGLPAGGVRVLYEKSHVWVATTAGVAMFDGERFHEIKQENGHGFAFVNGIVEASNGDLWMQSEREAWRVPAAELARVLTAVDPHAHAQRFDELDGLIGISSTDPNPSVTEGSDGRLWFATNAGVAWVDPTKVRADREISDIRIRSLLADGKTVPVDSGTPLPKLTDRIEIGFAAMVLGTPEKVRFRYRLDGARGGWTEVVNQHAAVFTNLRPGHHRFEVAAALGNANWSDPRDYDFRIDPAWYQTYWFYAICVLPFLGLLWVLHRMRLRRATAILQLQMDAKQSERERIARDLHDTLLQTVYGLMLRFEVVANHFQSSDPKRVLIDDALDQADRTIAEGRGRLSDLRNAVDLRTDFVSSMQKIGEEFARDYPSMTFSLRCDGAVRPLSSPVESETRMIVIEALTNAFRHAQANSVTLEISSAKNRMFIRVRDDGIGMEKELLESGRAEHWGLQGMRERARLIGAMLEVSSTVGGGTAISLTLTGAMAFA
jgi:signal transduction histidine kinase/ligand-binding sensor domain-containing protein